MPPEPERRSTRPMEVPERDPQQAPKADAIGRRESLWIAALLLLAGAGLAAWVHWVHAETPLIFDELVYLWQAKILGHGWIGAPVPRHHEFVSALFFYEREGRVYGQYPIGYPLALVPWVVARAPWALNVLLGVFSLFLLHRFARAIGGRREAWLATACLAISPFFIVQSTVFLTHPLTLALTLLVLYALLRRSQDDRRLRWAALCGGAIGYALNISPYVAVPMAAVCAERCWVGRSARRPSRRELLAFVLPFVAGVALFGAVNQEATGAAWRPAYFHRSFVRPGFGDEVGQRGFGPADALRITMDRLDLLDRMLFGWPIPSLLFAGIHVVGAALRARTRRGFRPSANRADPGGPVENDRWDRPLLILFLGTVIVYAFWYYPGTRDGLGPRYYYAALPTLVLFTARGFAALGDGVSRLAPRRWAAHALLSIACFCALFATGTVPYLARMADGVKPTERRAARAFLEELERRGVKRGTVFVESPFSKRARRGILLFQSNFDDRGDLVFAWDLGPGKNGDFLSERGGGPAYFARLDEKNLVWEISDTPPRP